MPSKKKDLKIKTVPVKIDSIGAEELLEFYNTPWGYNYKATCDGFARTEFGFSNGFKLTENHIINLVPIEKSGKKVKAKEMSIKRKIARKKRSPKKAKYNDKAASLLNKAGDMNKESRLVGSVIKKATLLASAKSAARKSRRIMKVQK